MIGLSSMPEAASSRELTRKEAEWLSQSWRLTAFLSTASPPIDVSWWKDVVGDEPDLRVDNPKQGLRQENGSYKNGTLVLTLQPGRVDWLYTAQRDAPEQAAEAPTLGPVGDALAEFAPVATNWLSRAPTLNRLAIGAVLEQPVQNRHEAYSLIMGMVPGLRLDAPCSDFLYQINRPRPSTAGANRTINRLSKWSAAALQIVQLEVARESGGALRPVSEFLTARLELDINTAPSERTPLEHSEVLRVYDELVNLGLEIAVKGDID